MYIFKNSFLRAKDSRDGYQNVDITNITMSDILENYVDGYITLTHRQINGTFYLTIEKLRSTTVPMVTTMTFNQWVAYNYSVELPTTKFKPNYSQTNVIYSDAIHANFKVDRVGRYLPLDANTSNADKVDLLLRKNIPNKNDLYTKIITTVAGFAHRTTSHEDGVAIIQGGDTFNNTGINTVGVLSFAKSCDLTQHAITEDMITPTSSTSPLYKELLINLGVSVENKTVILCIGGHLFINKGVGDVVNAEAGIVMVKLYKIDLVKMILNSVGKINLDTLGIFKVSEGATYNKVRIEDILSDVCVKKYMTLPQSFVIIANTECIQTEFDDVGITGIPGSYETKTEPHYPIVNSQGLMPEYWKTRIGDYWSVRLTDDVTKRYMFKTNIDTDNVLVNSMSPTHKWYHDDPKFMRIVVTTKHV